jgi:hypothetical protein
MRGCCDAVPRRFLVLQMAKAYRLTSNDAIAKECYERFLSLWKEADPDIPIYQIAKAEYAQLQQRATNVQ